MKITLGSRERGIAIILIALVVAIVIIVGIGGCVAGKCIANAKKYKSNRDHQLTNEVDNFANGMLEDYILKTGDTNARVLVSVQETTSPTETPETVLQWSTNLVDWNDYDGIGSLTSEVLRQAGSMPGALPAVFFRVKVL